MTVLLPRILLALPLAGFLAPTASAQKWRFNASKHTLLGRVSLDLASRGYRPSPRGTYRDARRTTVHRHGSSCGYVAGHYDHRQERVWIPGHTEQIWVPARYETITEPCGRTYTRLVSQGYYDYVQHPGHYETRTRRVWVPARYSCGYSSGSCGITPY